MIDFTTIALVIYGAEVSSGVGFVAGLFVCAVLLGLVVLAPFWMAEFDEIKPSIKRGVIVSVLVAGGIAIFMPSKTVIYAYAAGAFANATAQQLADAPEVAKLRALLNRELDKLIDDKK